MEQSVLDVRDGTGVVRNYRIHVSSKYLDLTKKKLELTRLPHELLVPRAREWDLGTPKSEIEPLVDYWLEHYSWRLREDLLNDNLSQFRTAISLPSFPHPIRVHFVHIKSPHEHAVPLLLLPSFPIPNLSPLLTPLFKSLTEPALPTSQPFHIVVPSIPGLGFSDPLQSDEHLLSQTAEIFNILMTERLGYEFYLASSTGSGRASPAGIDYHLPRLISENYPDHCLGAHLIEPVVQKPKLGSFWAWTKFTVAKFFHASIFGYTTEDFHSLREGATTSPSSTHDDDVTERSALLANSDLSAGNFRKPAGFGVVGTLGLREPNTLSYALCDSPVGLLSLVCSALRRASPNHTLNSEEIIDITQMAWLPGPEAGMRFWSCAVEEGKTFEKQHGRAKKAKIAVTVFSEGDGGEDGYVCPAWVQGRFKVVDTQRIVGRAGLIAYEQPDVVVAGVRGLAKGVDATDGRLQLARLEGVVVGGGAGGAQSDEEHVGDESFVQWDAESPSTIVAENPTSD